MDRCRIVHFVNKSLLIGAWRRTADMRGQRRLERSRKPQNTPAPHFDLPTSAVLAHAPGRQRPPASFADHRCELMTHV